MRREGRFPLLSIVIVLGFAAAIVILSSFDPGLPQRALGQVGFAVRDLGGSLLGVEVDVGDLFARQPQTQQQVPVPVLVNAQNPVTEGATPAGMVNMAAYCDPSLVQIKGNDIQGDRTAVDALMRMLQAAVDSGLGDWQVSAGYRSVAAQRQVWDEQAATYRAQGLSEAKAQEATAKYVAQPGYSEHHTGLAFDMTVPGESFPLTEQSKWLAENCWDYGFIIRYTEDKVAITGINAEPWHIRYVGEPHARTMRDNGWCLEEYIAVLHP